MSDIGGIGSLGNDPFASALQRQQGDGALEQQQRAQEQANLRAREALGLSESGSRSLRERDRNEILEEAGPGIRREEASREGDSPRLRQLSDETAEIDSAAIQRSRPGAQQAGRQENTESDQVNLSEEAQRRLSADQAAPPPPGETVRPEPNDPLTVDTPRERQEADLSDQVDRGLGETQANRPLGQVLDQFS